MPVYTQKFSELVAQLKSTGEEHDEILPAVLAQFILESARGSSKLATEHLNFAGMKWRPEMQGHAEKVLVDAPSETAYFCAFDSVEAFARGYWVFLARKPYEGGQTHADSPYDFIDFVAPIWAADPAYAEKLKDLLAEADGLLARHSQEDHRPEEVAVGSESGLPCCDGMADDVAGVLRSIALAKPAVVWDPSPFSFSRNGTEIDTIVLHYTTTRSLSSTRDWFKNPGNTKRTAIHYLIGRDGTVVQMVRDSEACNHGNSQNSRSIGIEHSAALGDKMTLKQEKASVALIQWLMQEYDIDRTRVIGHKCAPRSTSCPGDLFQDFGAKSTSTCAEVKTAVQAWLDAKVL